MTWRVWLHVRLVEGYLGTVDTYTVDLKARLAVKVTVSFLRLAFA